MNATAIRPLPDPEPRPLEAIASDIGELMADTAFAGLDRLEADYRAMCERFGIGEKA